MCFPDDVPKNMWNRSSFNNFWRGKTLSFISYLAVHIKKNLHPLFIVSFFLSKLRFRFWHSACLYFLFLLHPVCEGLNSEQPLTSSTQITCWLCRLLLCRILTHMHPCSKTAALEGFVRPATAWRYTDTLTAGGSNQQPSDYSTGPASCGNIDQLRQAWVKKWRKSTA